MDWLERGLKGEHLYLFSLACPDYSAQMTDDPNCPYIHTFNELGSGIGHIARRILDALPIIKTTLNKININFTPVLAMADYEVFNEANIKRLQLTVEEFLQRLESSRQAFQQQSEVILQTPMVTELCGGQETWKQLYKLYHQRFINHDFGTSSLNKKKLLELVKFKKPLYDRWHGKQTKLEDYLPILLSQGAEYSTIGAIIQKRYPNCLVLGADHHASAHFYNVDKILPSLYLRRFYR